MNEPTLLKKIILITALCFGGCMAEKRIDPAFYNNPSLHMEHDTSVSMNWLAIAGAVTIAFGVAGYMSGQKAAISILAGGITLLATGILVTQALCVFAELRTHATAILIGLGIIGFFIIAKINLDLNQDGKIDWQDIKAVFLKIRRKPKNP